MNKRKKLEIILNENPCFDDQHAWIRDISDILTFGEALRDSDWEGWENSGIDPDFTAEDVKKAIKTGKVKVYSSYPIKNGIFVSPSRMEAEAYSSTGKVFSRVVKLDDVAWIDPTQGQYAKD